MNGVTTILRIPLFLLGIKNSGDVSSFHADRHGLRWGNDHIGL